MGTYFATKHDSAAAEVIALLADEAEGYGMRDDSTGDADAPTGYFSLVTIPADVDLSADGDDPFGIEYLSTEYGVTPAGVAGTHIVTWDSQGFVSVETFASEAEARAVFDAVDLAYTRYVYGIPETVSDEDVDEWIAANPDPDGYI